MAQHIKPAVRSIEECHQMLCQPGGPFEIVETMLHGRNVRVFKHAPKDIRVLWDTVLQVDPKKEWFVYENERITYGEGVQRVQAISHILDKAYGIKPGDHVGIASRNFPEYMLILWAVMAMGAVVVPLNAWLVGEELLFCASDSDCKMVFCDLERIQRLEPHYAALFDPSKSKVQHLVALRDEGKPLKPAPSHGTICTMDQFMAKGDRKWRDIEAPRAQLKPEDGLMILFTSGTTGLPKGAYICQQGWLQGTLISPVVMARYFLRRGDPLPEPVADPPQRVNLQVAPWFHGTGLWPTITGSTTGAKYVLMYKWEPGLALELIEREKINAITAVPTIVWQLLEHPDVDKRDISSFDTMMYSGAPAAAEIVPKLQKLIKNPAPGFAFSGLNVYGMTEFSTGIIYNLQEDYLRKPDSVGTVNPLFDVKIVDEETGEELPRGEKGEIWAKGPGVIAGYYKRPEANAKDFTPDGYLKTGDVGIMDEEGFVFMKDRSKNMLIRGGENIYAAEVEQALMQYPNMLECAVVGVPHRVLGEEVGCVARVRPEALEQMGEKKLTEDIVKFMRTKMAVFKIPTHWDFRTEELVKTGSMKVLKRQLKIELLDKLGLGEKPAAKL